MFVFCWSCDLLSRSLTRYPLPSPIKGVSIPPKPRLKHTHAAHTQEKHRVFLLCAPHLPLIICPFDFCIIRSMDALFGHETKPTHFFIPVPIFIIGGLFVSLPGAWDVWDWIGGLIIASGAACIFFLIYTAVKDKELRVIEQEHYHLAEVMKLDAAKTKTKVAIEKTDLTGYMYQNYAELDIAPAKIKKFAIGVLREGRKMTIREWTPLKKGKTFSDGEWRRLIAFMKQPDWEDRRLKFIVPINANNENDGFELTAAGRKWLEDVLKEVALAPISV
jgi:hypothetical protein